MAPRRRKFWKIWSAIGGGLLTNRVRKSIRKFMLGASKRKQSCFMKLLILVQNKLNWNICRRAAKDVPLLKSLGITHIINAACTEVKTGEVFYLQQGHRFTLLTIDISDSPTANISTYFEEVNRFIEVALHTGGI